MTSRRIRIGKLYQIVTMQWGPNPKHEIGSEPHEHVTLETPKPVTDTARLRVLALNDAGKSWRS
jgi:hypothetical protein